MADLPPIKRVTEEELRELFNRLNYWSQAKSGQLIEKILRERHPSPPLAPVPHCTKSQLVSYIDAKDQEMARVHQYLLPDGQIGASGRPDPKRLFHDGTLYRLVKKSTSATE